MNSTQNLKNIPFGKFVDQILGYANETFSTLHHKFLKEIWSDNSTVRKLHKNQCFTDWQNGRYEVYIPTRDNPEYNLSYYRVAIQVQELNSNDTKHAEAYTLMNHLQEPLGIVESELLILIAPHQDRWGLVRGFKHRQKRGYFTAVFTNTSPEIIWKRVLDHLANFNAKCLDGMFNSLGFETWVWKWALNKDISLYYSILKHYSFVLRQQAFTLIHLCNHFRKLMQGILKEIGIANTAKQVLRPLEGMKLPDLTRVFDIVRENMHLIIQAPASNDRGLLLLEQLARR